MKYIYWLYVDLGINEFTNVCVAVLRSDLFMKQYELCRLMPIYVLGTKRNAHKCPKKMSKINFTSSEQVAVFLKSICKI